MSAHSPHLHLPHSQLSQLGWNMIRLTGAYALCSSLAFNQSLTYLDLSFNALGTVGGLALGDALIENRTLKTLLLQTNSIDTG